MLGKIKPTVTQDDMEEAMFGLGNYGACTMCGEMAYDGCEPDARNYECEVCGEKAVYGLAELVVLNHINLTGPDYD